MTDREIMQQALDALLHMCNTTKAQNDYNAKIVDKALVTLEAALAQPEQEEPLPLVDIGVDVTPEGTHVVACYNKPDAVQEMFYSQFHPLAKPEQEPVDIHCPSCLHSFSIVPVAKREWVGLTINEVWDVYEEDNYDAVRFARAIEAKLKEKNNG